jgi:hypothetical protein
MNAQTNFFCHFPVAQKPFLQQFDLLDNVAGVARVTLRAQQQAIAARQAAENAAV